MAAPLFAEGLPSSSTAAQAHSWFELIVEGVPGAILLADAHRIISLVNRNAEQLFGYSRSELIGQPLELLVPQRFRARHPDFVAQFFAEPQVRPMGAGRDLFGLRRDGVEVPIEIGLNPISTPSGVFTLASIIDITERKRAEEMQQQMAALVEFADDAILAKNLDGVIHSWNPAAERLLGYRAEEIIGQPVTRLLPADRQDEEMRILARIGSGERVADFETLRRCKDGSLVPVSLTISPIRKRAGGSIVGASTIMRDITERRRNEEHLRHSNEQLAQINKELDEFVYTASHDLRSPLTGVSRVAQWILEDDRSLTAQSRERLGLIQGRIGRMYRLLDDVREYARAGRFAEPSGPELSAAALLAEITATLHVPAGFAVRAAAGLEQVRINRVPLEQVLHNLIANAIRHHDRAAGMVTVSAEARAAGFRFSVIDDGPGIPEQYREAVFEMFRTLKPRDQVEGSGMGLAMVRKIVGRLGGQCGVQAADGGGAHFWFDWPAGAQTARGHDEII
jgi:PAS domain S-box-containing protein